MFSLAVWSMLGIYFINTIQPLNNGGLIKEN